MSLPILSRRSRPPLHDARSTAALDHESKRTIRKPPSYPTRSPTINTIAQRLVLLRNFVCIVMPPFGRIIELDHPMLRQGLYREVMMRKLPRLTPAA
jgi:hypothetical protein